MTAKEIYRQYLQQLQQIYNANEAAVITDWVFESVGGLQRFDIIKNPDQPIKRKISTQLNLSLASLLQHKPVQYVLNEAWFYKMKLKVNENVLIPRPETEELVQLVMDDRRNEENVSVLAGSKQSSGPRHQGSMLDIGTGSGCIAIAIKKNLPTLMVHAIDVSAGALLIAKENAAIQGVDIEFLQIDFLDETLWEGLPVFDAIISNPPYIPLNEKEKLDKNVTAFEPHSALFVPDNSPYLFYEKIAAFGKKHLNDQGKIYVEIHEDFAEETMNFFKQSYVVKIRKDIFGKERMVVASKLMIRL